MTHSLIGVDFGKTNVRFGVSDGEPRLITYTKRPYARGTPQDITHQIVEGVDQALAEVDCGRDALQGIGISVPAVVDRETGVIAWGPDWDFMAGASLTAPISAHYNVPVVADVDTVIPTWGENWAGAGRSCKRFAVLAWGTGLGAGLVIDGEVQEYPDNLFPEFGHSRVSDDDWPCKCGAIGCVDTMVCGGGIARHGRISVQSGSPTLLRELCGGRAEAVTSQMVFDAAEQGDTTAIVILDRIAVLLGRLCANVVLTMQPERIVFVGGLAERSPRLLTRISTVMAEGCWLLQKGLTKCEVTCSELGDTAGVLGAIRKVQMCGKQQWRNL